MIDAEQDVLLILYVLDLFESDDVSNGQYLERPVLPRAFLTAKNDASERSSTYETRVNHTRLMFGVHVTLK